jgi:uncharacterized repeat protein (TIGR04042 family)
VIAMPELHFRVRWPDGRQQRCYSPSRAVTEFLVAGESYALEDFVGRSRAALELASERVRRRYGVACTSAAAQLAEIERVAGAFEPGDGAVVTVVSFEEA